MWRNTWWGKRTFLHTQRWWDWLVGLNLRENGANWSHNKSTRSFSLSLPGCSVRSAGQTPLWLLAYWVKCLSGSSSFCLRRLWWLSCSIDQRGDGGGASKDVDVVPSLNVHMEHLRSRLTLCDFKDWNHPFFVHRQVFIFTNGDQESVCTEW